MIYKQIIFNNGLPFDVKIPTALPVDISLLTDEEVSVEIKKELDAIKEGRIVPTKKVFKKIRND